MAYHHHTYQCIPINIIFYIPIPLLLVLVSSSLSCLKSLDELHFIWSHPSEIKLRRLRVQQLFNIRLIHCNGRNAGVRATSDSNLLGKGQGRHGSCKNHGSKSTKMSSSFYNMEFVIGAFVKRGKECN